MTEGEFQKQLKKYHKTRKMPVELAIKLLSECAMDCVYEEETEEAKFMAIKALEQEPKTGHWYYKYGEEVCSVCNEGIDDAQTFDGRPFKYCPMCGARMVEPQESEINNG